MREIVATYLTSNQADFGKAEEPEIKLPTSAGSWKKKESSRKISISALLPRDQNPVSCIAGRFFSV